MNRALSTQAWILLACLAGCDGESSGPAETDPSRGNDVSSSPGEPSASTGTASTTGGGPQGEGTSNATRGATSSQSDGEGAGPETTDDPGSGFCPAGTLPPGRYDGVSLEHGGLSRTYDLYIPETVDVTQPATLVLNFHGLLGNPAQQAVFSLYDAAAADAGVIVAYPAGTSNSWNSGLCCGGAQSSGIDDVGFARTVVQHIGLGSCVDTAKVFAIGMSNGGHMAHRLACEAADVFAGVASVAGVLTMLECSPARPISVQQFHGTADTIVRYDGVGPGFPGARDTMQSWAARNGCAPVPNVTHQQGDSTCETWTACDDGVEVTLCTVEGGGHCWPGNASCTFGSSTTDVAANDVFAQLMASQSLPGG
ncbi:MAG: extracellular catalytic domain type 1 short-chain-length polyhydroxyalkanoate depolymerase [Nannocystales bacterium]